LRLGFNLQKLSGTLCVSTPSREDGNKKEEIKMGSWLRRYSFSAFTMLLCAGFSAGADLQSAKRAYQQKDFATAFKESTVLAGQGNADAQFILGQMYLMGQGVLKDPDQAIKWFKASASQGNADAQFYLGSYYLLPQRDITEGVKWLRLSAEQGQQDAQYLLGKAYIQGSKEFPPDPVQGEMWLRLAAKHNLDFYQNELLGAEKQMTGDQIAKGKALAEGWRPKPGLRPDGKPGADGKAGS
jgi:Sel1 repeat